MIQGLQLVKTTDWNDVFRAWQSAEGSDPVWRKFAMDVKGWDSWESWRSNQAKAMNADARAWEMYDITDPNRVIPAMLMGPFAGWQKQYPESEWNTHTFSELVSDHLQWVAGNDGILSKKKDFAVGTSVATDSTVATQFIGIYLEDEDAIVLFEGHHRAAAIALAVAEGAPLRFSVLPTIALTRMKGEEKHQLLSLLRKGTHNPEKK